MACLQPQWLDHGSQQSLQQHPFQILYWIPTAFILTSCPGPRVFKSLPAVISPVWLLSRTALTLTTSRGSLSPLQSTGRPHPVLWLPYLQCPRPQSHSLFVFWPFFFSLHLPDHLNHCLIYSKCYIYYTGNSQVCI